MGSSSSTVLDTEARLSDELDRQLEKALDDSASEMDGEGLHRTARAMRVARDYVLQYKDVLLDRLVAANVVILPKEQHDTLLGIVAREMVHRAIADAKQRGEEDSQRFWTTTAAKVAFLTGVVSLILIALGQIYLILHGVARPIGIP